tara:strand:- start:1319 stop:2758 length:1440 start_codon:yes stop_codon:yes gene_type:complete
MKKLSSILKGVNYKGNVDDRIVTGIFYDSRKIKKDSLFIAIKGFNVDGHNYIDKAIELGANSVLVDKNIDNKYEIPLLTVDNTRKAMSHIASNFFNDCSKNIKITGITGTNGKTSVTHLVNHILQFNNHTTSSLGTLGFHSPNGNVSTGFTTPESLELQNIFKTLYTGGITHLNMEVSSHAIALNRIDDVDIDIAVFTNLTSEHLDFHGNLDNYFNTKLKLFSRLSSKKIAIINNDDPYANKIINQTKAKVLTYGFNDKSDIFPERIKLSLTHSEFYVIYKKNCLKIRTKLIGDFNISNILASILVCLSQGLNINDIVKAINDFDIVPGRVESYKKKNGGIIIIDYAHTPDAFEKILSLVKKIKPKYKITTLFGCGGNRDSHKRPLMGLVSEKFSDRVIVTNDNPRNENPNEIIDQIISGFKSEKYQVICDRKEAVEQAVKNLKKNQALLILGKGIEQHQIMNDKKIYHSDIKIVKNLL